MRIRSILPFVLMNQAPGDGGTGAGAPPPPPAGTPPAAAPPSVIAPAPAASPSDKDPAWLPDRIAQAKKNAEADLLKQLGVSDVDAAKKAIATAKEKEDAEKSADVRAAEAKAKAEKAESEANKLRGTVKEYADRMMVGLSDPQKDAVKKLAGDDPAKQLEAITALAPTWAKDAGAGDGKAPTTITTVVDTAPGKNAPPAPAGTSPASPRAAYEDLRKTNPFAAASYGLTNPEVYDDKHYAKE